MTTLSMAGEQWSAPALPPAVELDSVTGSYNTTADVTMRLHTSDHDLSQMTVNGIVRGTSTTLSPGRFRNVSLFTSNLTLDVLDTSEGTTTVQVALRDNASGAPISTERRQGYVVVNGQRLNTSADGTANLTVSSSTTAFEARYVPGEWWRGESTYVGDTAIIAEQTTVLSLLETLFRIGIPIGMLLVAIFLIDRITGWRIWPPWGPHRCAVDERCLRVSHLCVRHCSRARPVTRL